MPQVGPTLFAHYLRAGHTTAVIARFQNDLRFGGLEKTGPTTAGIELGFRKEQGFTAAAAVVYTIFGAVPVLAGKRLFSALFAAYVKFFRG
jgi:hypothetical protein